MNFIDLVESYKEDIIKSTQNIVAIKSVEEEAKPNMPFGVGPYKALEFALNLADEMGFKTKNLEGYAGHADLGEGEEVVGILAHLDVVPEGGKDGLIHLMAEKSMMIRYMAEELLMIKDQQLLVCML